MDVILGAWLSGTAGAVTGWAAARIKSAGTESTRVQGTMPTSTTVPTEPSKAPNATLMVILGALTGTLAYGGFLVVGMVVGLLTFNTKADPVPALISVLAGCGLFLGFVWVEKNLLPKFGLPARSGRGPRRIEDLLDAKPIGGDAARWIGGIAIPLLPAGYGLQCILTQSGRIGYWIGPDKVHGGGAVALGAAWIAIGAFLHFHFFFGLHPALSPYSRRGKTIALVVACLGFITATLWSMAAMT
jgi:hypothetical protein